MKQQENPPEEELDEMEASNLSDREFRLIIIKIFKSMKKRHRNHKKGIRNKEFPETYNLPKLNKEESENQN